MSNESHPTFSIAADGVDVLTDSALPRPSRARKGRDELPAVEPQHPTVVAPIPRKRKAPVAEAVEMELEAAPKPRRAAAAAQVAMAGPVDEAPQQEVVKGSRKEKSLATLCTNFLDLCEGADDGTIDLKQAADELGVPKRRMYDIMNVLQAVDLVTRAGKNAYIWHGLDAAAHALARLQRSIIAEADNTAPPQTCPFGARPCVICDWRQDPSKQPPVQVAQTTKFLRYVARVALATGYPVIALDEVSLIVEDDEPVVVAPPAAATGRRAAAAGSRAQAQAAAQQQTLAQQNQGAQGQIRNRRVYDIINVLTAIGLIRKAALGAKRPGFSWTAFDITALVTGYTESAPVSAALRARLRAGLGRLDHEAPAAAAQTEGVAAAMVVAAEAASAAKTATKLAASTKKGAAAAGDEAAAAAKAAPAAAAATRQATLSAPISAPTSPLRPEAGAYQTQGRLFANPVAFGFGAGGVPASAAAAATERPSPDGPARQTEKGHPLQPPEPSIVVPLSLRSLCELNGVSLERASRLSSGARAKLISALALQSTAEQMTAARMPVPQFLSFYFGSTNAWCRQQGLMLGVRHEGMEHPFEAALPAPWAEGDDEDSGAAGPAEATVAVAADAGASLGDGATADAGSVAHGFGVDAETEADAESASEMRGSRRPRSEIDDDEQGGENAGRTLARPSKRARGLAPVNINQLASPQRADSLRGAVMTSTPERPARSVFE